MNDSLYPRQMIIRAMGLNQNDFESWVIQLISPHCTILEGAVSTQLSRDQKYISVRVKVQIQNQAQLESIDQALGSDQRVLMRL